MTIFDNSGYQSWSPGWPGGGASVVTFGLSGGISATTLYSITHDGDTKTLYQIEGGYGLLKTWSLEGGVTWQLLKPKGLTRVLNRLMRLTEAMPEAPDDA